MQTVSKYGAAADTEAQAPARPEQKPLGRATVAAICVAAALSGAAVASVARVHTRAYVADLVGGVSYRMGGKKLLDPPTPLNGKRCGDLTCEGTEECYQKSKDGGETKYKCAAEGSLGSKWINTETTSKKKKPGPGSLSGGGDKPDKIMCAMVHRPVCDTEGNWHTNACVAEHQKFKTISSEHVFDNGKCVKRR